MTILVHEGMAAPIGGAMVAAVMALQGMALELPKAQPAVRPAKVLHLACRAYTKQAAFSARNGGKSSVIVYGMDGIEPIGFATSAGDFVGRGNAVRRSLTCWLSNGHGFTKDVRRANVDLLRGVLKVRAA